MSVQQSFEKLISLAIQREEEAYEFYLEAAKIAELSSSAKLLQDLAKQEVGHKEKLESALAEGVCETFACDTQSDFEDMELSKYLVDIPLAPDSLPQDIMIIAIKKEDAATNFYQTLSELTGNAGHRTVFDTMAKEELNHKNRLEQMYDDIFQPDN
ncbi:MAG: ferritin-like domain-containing protein [Candidatus Thorarchaeota archaeon]|jgi:rubrerythrin